LIKCLLTRFLLSYVLHAVSNVPSASHSAQGWCNVPNSSSAFGIADCRLADEISLARPTNFTIWPVNLAFSSWHEMTPNFGLHSLAGAKS
jgi:hypothetical protein